MQETQAGKEWKQPDENEDSDWSNMSESRFAKGEASAEAEEAACSHCEDHIGAWTDGRKESEIEEGLCS